jgi:hypothetical protein
MSLTVIVFWKELHLTEGLPLQELKFFTTVSTNNFKKLAKLRPFPSLIFQKFSCVPPEMT